MLANKWMIGLMLLSMFTTGCDESSSEDAESAQDSIATEAEVSEEENSVEEQTVEESAEENGTEAEVEPNLGAKCEVNEDCVSPSGYPTCITTQLIKSLGLSDTAEVPEGYCSDMTCEASSDCGDSGVLCIDLSEDTTGVTDMFNICLVECEADSSTCGDGSQCYCDADQGIFTTEGETEFCTCMPEAIITLLTE